MTPAGTNLLLAHAADAPAPSDVVTKSLRFNDGDSPTLTRTPSSGGNRRTFTWSGWVKLASVGAQAIFEAGTVGVNSLGLQKISTHKLQFFIFNGSSVTAEAETAAVFRDYAAFYHIVVAVDTTDSTPADRIKIYVNGVRQTIETSTPPSLNLDTNINTAIPHYLGRAGFGTYSYWDGYMADVYFIDGTALTPTSFAEEDETTGQWKPIEYDTADGAYGTNGFHLDFKEDSATSGSNAGIGKDVSGNGNYLNTTNLAASDVMEDTPTDNYCVLNPLDESAAFTYSEGNLQVTWSDNDYLRARGTIGMTSGKWYFEFLQESTSTGNAVIWGVKTSGAELTNDSFGSGTAMSDEWILTDAGYIANSGGGTSVLGSVSNGDIVQVAVDMDAGKIWFGLDNTWDGDPAAGTGERYSNLPDSLSPLVGIAGGATVRQTFANFGQSDFAHTPPENFKALSTANLPPPTIAKPSEHFNTKIWTGDGSSSDRDITGLSFEPDLIWYKSRTDATQQCWQDSVRGWGTSATGTKFGSSSTQVENGSYFETQYGYIGATVSGSGTANGFTVAQGPSGLQDMVHTNMSAKNYVAWNWKGGSTATNENYNAAAGFSIIKWTGDSDSDSTREITHSLGVAPEFIIAKNRTNISALSTGSWIVYHKDLTSGYNMKLNDAADEFEAFSTLIGGITNLKVDFGNDSSNSEYLNYLDSMSGPPAVGDDYVAYLFAGVSSFSKFGTYEGNGSVDGAFAYCGFRPSWIMVTSIENAIVPTSWYIHDTARSPYNYSDLELAANSSAAEYSPEPLGAGERVDILSNGFKNRSTNNAMNESGQTYIYAAFAESPFKYAVAR